MNRLLFIFVVILQLCSVLADMKRICYYTNWAQYRKDRGYGFFPEDIDPSLCTHIIYAFGKVENNAVSNFEWNDILSGDGGPGMYPRVMAGKKKNPNLKVLLAIGGWNAGSTEFLKIVSSQANMDSFAKTAITFLRSNKFDGLDVDWEFPTLHKNEFNKYLETLRVAFEMESIVSGNARLLLTAAVSAGQAISDTSYDVKRISELLDFINLMAYDLHGAWETNTGFNAPLYARDDESEYQKTLNVDWAVKYWIGHGAPPDKIMLGLALYGRGFMLTDPNNNKVGSPRKGPSTAGKIVTEEGMLSYYEICIAMKNNDTVYSWNDVQQVPSIQFGSNWIGYDNEKSLAIKVQYARSMCLGGIMVWALDFDDFQGKYCQKGKYPLMNTVIDALGDGSCINNTNSVSSTTTVLTTTSRVSTLSTVITTTTASNRQTTTVPSNLLCNNKLELLADASDCSSFYLCMNGSTTPISKVTCPNGTWFNSVSSSCVSTMPMSCVSSMTSTVTTPKTTQSMSTSSTSTDIEITCEKPSGMFPHPQSCSLYISCANNVAYVQSCPTGLVFNEEFCYCDYSSKRCPKNNYYKSQNVLHDELNVYECPEESGLFPNTDDCSSFWNCANRIPYLMKCPDSLMFNSVDKVCGYSNTTCQSTDDEMKLKIKSKREIKSLKMMRRKKFK